MNGWNDAGDALAVALMRYECVSVCGVSLLLYLTNGDR